MTNDERIEAMARAIFKIAADDDDYFWEDYIDVAQVAWAAADVEGMVREAVEVASEYNVISTADIEAIVKRVMQGVG